MHKVTIDLNVLDQHALLKAATAAAIKEGDTPASARKLHTRYGEHPLMPDKP